MRWMPDPDRQIVYNFILFLRPRRVYNRDEKIYRYGKGAMEFP